MSFIPHTESDTRQMLSVVGVGEIDALFEDIPRQLRFPELGLGPPMSEQEVLTSLSHLAKENTDMAAAPVFLGAGAWRHFRPATVDYVLQRGEFCTAYTPYQAEISQGMLQAAFEYQSLVCGLTGMDVSNASHYDGATSLAEGALLALHASHGKRSRLVLAPGVTPRYRDVMRTYLRGTGATLVDAADLCSTEEEIASRVNGEVAALVVQSPDFLGRLQPLDAYARIAHDAGALLIAIPDPIALGLFKSPGELGADIVAAEGQPLGIPLGFGGPHLGIFAVRSVLARQVAGRLVGETTDSEGKRGYVLTLATREQHIRRARATSNICTNSALSALAAAVYLTTMGPGGLRTVAGLCYQKSHYAAQQIAALNGFGVHIPGTQPTFFRDFVVRLPLSVVETNRFLWERHRIVGGYDLSADYPALGHTMLLSVTECNTREDIDRLVDALKTLAA